MAVTYVFSPNTKIQSSQVNQNFNDILVSEWTALTPTIYGGTNAGTATYGGIRTGVYCQIRKIIFFSLSVQITNHTGTGNLIVGGLPVAAANYSNILWQCNVLASNLTMPANTLYITGDIEPNNNFIYLAATKDGGAAELVQMDTACTIYINGCYGIS